MDRELKNQRIPEDLFQKERAEVLQQWPTGRDIDFKEAVEYQLSIDKSKRFGEKLAKEGVWDSLYGMWLPVAVLTPVAIYLTYKATNDSSLLDTDWYDVRIRKLRRRISKYIPEWMKIGKHKRRKRKNKNRR